ncbi:hypothetical protein BH18ACT17_BH18ACT17_00100 [soil metagenome]
MCGVSLTLMATSLGIKIAFGMVFGVEDTALILPALLGGGAFAVVGAVIASRTGNATGWIFLAIAASFSIALPSQNWLDAAAETERNLAFLGLANWLNQWPFFFSLGLLIAVFYLFPTGTVPSSRWRMPWLVYKASLAATVIGFAINPYEQEVAGNVLTNPIGVEPLATVLGTMLAVAGVTLVLSAFASLASLIVRARGADPETRQQIRWLGAVGRAGGVLFVVTLVFSIASGGGDTGTAAAVAGVSLVLLTVAVVVGIPAATAVAIFRYHLYDLTIVVRRAVLVTIMATAITLLYVSVVVAVPALLRRSDDRGIDVLPLVAAAIVALAFDPLRRGARRLADRVVYGERATPYEVLTAFGERVGDTYSNDDVLPRMVQVLAQGTGARSASVWLRVGDEYRREAWWPDDVEGPRALSGTADGLPTFDGEHGFEVRHQGELLGALTVSMPASEPLDPSKERLVRDLAAQAGLLLRNVRLIEDLRASRQRLVAAQDEERRKLERNLHDGAQQQLVALAVQLKLARTMVDRDPATAGSMLDSLQGAAGEALEELRDLARGIYPPLLADKGLAAALESQARKAVVPTTVRNDGIGRYPRDVESAVYSCTLEALNNVAKYADAGSVDVRLAQENGHLTFSVHDDGRGFDAAAATFGTGLQGMTDRLDAIGGDLLVTSVPGAGTTVTGRIPAREASASPWQTSGVMEP